MSSESTHPDNLASRSTGENRQRRGDDLVVDEHGHEPSPGPHSDHRGRGTTRQRAGEVNARAPGRGRLLRRRCGQALRIGIRLPKLREQPYGVLIAPPTAIGSPPWSSSGRRGGSASSQLPSHTPSVGSRDITRKPAPPVHHAGRGSYSLAPSKPSSTSTCPAPASAATSMVTSPNTWPLQLRRLGSWVFRRRVRQRRGQQPLRHSPVHAAVRTYGRRPVYRRRHGQRHRQGDERLGHVPDPGR